MEGTPPAPEPRRRRHLLSVLVLVLAPVGLAISRLGEWYAQADAVNLLAIYWLPLMLLVVPLAAWRIGTRGARWFALVLFALTLWQGAALFRPVLQPRPDIGADPIPLRVVSYNMYKNSPSTAKDAIWVEEQDADFVVLLEARRINKAPGDRLRAKYPVMLDCSGTERCSTILLSRFPLLSYHPLALGDAENREALSALVATFDVEGVPLTLLVVHLDQPWPLGDQGEFLPQLVAAAAKVDGPALMVGDFNSVPWAYAVQSAADDNGFRIAELPSRSWPAGAPKWLRLPLDQLHLKGPVRVKRMESGPQMGSDHRPIIAELLLKR